MRQERGFAQYALFVSAERHCLAPFALAVSVLLLVSLQAVAGTTGEVTFDIGNATGFPGGTVDVPVTIQSTGTRPSAVSFQVEFDTSRLSYASVTAGSAATSAGKEATGGIGSDQRLNVLILGENQFSIADGSLVTIRFQVLSTATQGQSLTLEGVNPDASDQQSDRIPSQILGGTITVGTCSTPSAPAGVAASDGDYTDHVRISWNHVSGATWYRIYRGSTANDTAPALVTTVLGTLNYGMDTSAAAPSVRQAAGCGGQASTAFTTYYYWVQAYNACGESDLAGPDSGYRGVGKAASNGLTAAKSLPSASAETPLPVDSPVAVRLCAEDPIDPASVWGVVTGEDFEDDAVSWSPSQGEDANSGWAVYRPRDSWLPGELVVFKAGARTVNGEIVGPVTAVFPVGDSGLAEKVSETVPQPRYGEFDSSGMDLSAESQSEVIVALADNVVDRPSLEGGVGPVYALLPEVVYTQPQRVWLPVPEGIDVSAVDLYAFIRNDWFPAPNVDGLLAADSLLTLDRDSTAYFGFLARHGAVVQLGVSSTVVPQTSAASAAANWNDLTGHSVLVAILLIALSSHRLMPARTRTP